MDSERKSEDVNKRMGEESVSLACKIHFLMRRSASRNFYPCFLHLLLLLILLERHPSSSLVHSAGELLHTPSSPSPPSFSFIDSKVVEFIPPQTHHVSVVNGRHNVSVVGSRESLGTNARR
jgi:hypothetical protein